MQTGASRLQLHPQGAVWLADDGTALTGAIRGRLERLGHSVRVIRPSEPELPAPGETLSGLIVLAPQAVQGSSWIKDVFRLVQTAATALRRAGSLGGASFLTVSRLDGSFGLSGLLTPVDPASGALAGLAKTARAEWPEVHCKAVDLPRDLLSIEAAADQVVAEFRSDGPGEVGLSPEGPVQVELEPLSLEPAEANRRDVRALDRGDVVVISGGARGITAEVAVALAGSFGPRLVLLGRTPAPAAEPDWLAPLAGDVEIRRAIREHAGKNCTPQTINEQLRTIFGQREIRRTLERIKAAGSQVSYHAVDVRDRGAIASLVRGITDQSGPIRGLIHAAGVLADRRIEDQTASQFAQVFDTKVEGLHSLVEAVDQSALRFLVVFSSSTARFGRTGQVAYAAANEFLNKWAQREATEHSGCRTVAFNWGPWNGGMVSDSLKPIFEREGLGLIPLAEGARLLVEEIDRPGPRPTEIVVLADPPGEALRQDQAPASAHDHSRANGKLEPVLERTIDLGSLPVIQSHVIDGHAVLPMALILEWLAKGAVHGHPGMVVQGVDELKLFKGVVLRGQRPVCVSIRAGKRQRRGGLQIVPVEMHGVLDARPGDHSRPRRRGACRSPRRPACARSTNPNRWPWRPIPTRSIARFSSTAPPCRQSSRLRAATTAVSPHWSRRRPLPPRGWIGRFARTG